MQDLQDPKEAQAYLNAALMDEDPRVFLLALKNVLEVQEKTKINHLETFYSASF